VADERITDKHAGQCEMRYRVAMKRDEPFEVTYRCGRQAGHKGACGADDGGPFIVPEQGAAVDTNRRATHAENLMVIHARLFGQLSVAEQRELEAAANALRQLERELAEETAALKRHVQRLASHSAERSNVLEEAAQVCEQMRPVNAGSHVLQVQRDTLDNAARLIRALRSSEQPTSAAAGSTKAAKGEDSHREGLATESHATTRDEIIEECAKVADERAGTVNADKSVTAMYIAERIRSLKNTPIAASATRTSDRATYFIALNRPGLIPELKIPTPQNDEGIAVMLRELHRLYPDAGTTLIHTTQYDPGLWLNHGREWLLMHDQTKASSRRDDGTDANG
jgi:hypothetical protein